ncbi:hypothetical protein ACF0H5_001530 [Mactra antiquata]
MRYNAIGGIMLSSLDMDDYSGIFCTGDIYPLLITIHEQIVAPLPPNTYEQYHRSQAEKFQVYQPQPSTNVTATTRSLHQPPLPTTAYPTTPTADVSSTDSQMYASTYAYYYDITTEVAPSNNEMMPVNRWQGSEHVISSNAAQQIPYQPQSADNLTNPGPPYTNTIAGSDTNANVVDKTNELQLAHQIQGTIDNQIASNNEKSKFGTAGTFGTPQTGTIATETKVNDNSQISGGTINQHKETIIAPAKETELRTFLKDAGTLPTHHLINGILGILSLNEEQTTTTTTVSPVRTTTLSPTTTAVPITTTEEKPHSRVHAILPFSILSSLKGPISLFGGSTVAESRPIAEGVTNIWQDPYAQQFLRNSRLFKSRKSALNKQSTPNPHLFRFTGRNTVNPSQFSSQNVGITI